MQAIGRQPTAAIRAPDGSEKDQVFNLKPPPPFSLSDQQTYAGDRQLPGGRGQVSRLTYKRETGPLPAHDPCPRTVKKGAG